MSKSVVGALRVTLGLDSAQFQTGLKNAQTGLQKFGSMARAGALAVTAAMVTAGGAVAAGMKKIVDEADAMSKMSQSIGIPIDDLTRMKYAADLSGVSMQQLGVAVKRLSMGMMELAQGGTGPSATALAGLGISATDSAGKLRSTSAVIADVADRFSKMQDGAQKTALAMQVFGKSGADMIPMLNGGAEGLRELYAEAEELGLVLDEQTGKAAEAFNDNLTRLGKVKDGIITKITAGMLPSMLQLSEAMVGSAKNSDAMRIVGEALGWSLKALVSVAVAVGAAFIGVASDIGAAWDAANRFVRGDFKGGQAAWSAGTSRTQTLLRGAEDFVKTLWRPPSGLPPAITRTSTALDTLDRNTGRAARTTRGLTDAQREAAQAARDLENAAKRVFSNTRTPAENYASDLAEIQNLLRQGYIDADTYARALRQLNSEFGAIDQDPIGTLIRDQNQKDRWAAQDQARKLAEDSAQAASDYRRDMQNATYDGIAGGLYAAADGDLGKYLAAKLKQNLIEGLAKSLTESLGRMGGGAGGTGWANSIGRFFAGFPGFKTGGGFTVGGSGPADSKVMGLRLSPGEMVDIRKPGQASEGGGYQMTVTPSPYFDVQVQKVAAPLAIGASAQGVQVARQAIPAEMGRRANYRLR